jgi:hypothetical protein
MRGRLGLLMHTGSGAASGAVIYFEPEPDEHLGATPIAEAGRQL